MLVASGSLAVEGWAYSAVGVLGGALAGAVFLAAVNRQLAERDELVLGVLEGAGARKALLILGVMTVHSFAEGVGIGVAFGGENELGSLISWTIAAHNVPEVGCRKCSLFLCFFFQFFSFFL